MATVTIVIPSYNHGKFIIDRLYTILCQTYKDWEAIIIDDKSSDDSVEIINDFLAKNTSFKVKHFIVNSENSGSGYKSWAKGIELATTEFIWIAETDDYSSPEFLEKVVGILEKNLELALAFCNSNYVDINKEFLYDSSKRTSILNVEREKYKIIESVALLDSLPLNPLITNGSSVVFRKPSDEIPKEILEHKQISDLFLWTYLVKNSTFGFLNMNLNFFRRHEDSTTTKNLVANEEKLYDEIVAYANYFHLSKSKSKAIVYDYVKKNLFRKNSKRILNTSPLRNLQNINKFETVYFFLESICKIYYNYLIKI